MNDFVYICKSGENHELKYSIRSVIKCFPNANIWVVGGKPNWYIGNYIELKQSGAKYKNAYENLKLISNSDQISNDFYLMNDDFYIIKDIKSIEMFHGGLLDRKVNLYETINPKSAYTSKLRLTLNKLLNLGIQYPYDYELHVPMLMNKENLFKSLQHGDKLLWRSMYGNLYNVGGTEIEDVKVYMSGKLSVKSYDLKKDKYPFLSSSDSSFDYIHNKILKVNFPIKTLLEK